MVLEQWRSTEEGANVSLEDVLRVSLPSSRVQAIDDMALLSFPRLRICNLPRCFISDPSALYGCVNLLKLDLSNNQIEDLPHSDFWFSLSSLRVLYLHGNAIGRKSCLQWLNHCPRLHVLTLHSTPLALSRDYRHYVVNGHWTGMWCPTRR
jgi:Leucine-rich repeat (LRR) protein